MIGGEKHGSLHPMFSLLFLLLLLFTADARSTPVEITITSDNPLPAVRFRPLDNYLIDCGAPHRTQLDDGRTFRSDPQSVSFLSAVDNIKIVSTDTNNGSIAPIYLSARVFTDHATYKFHVSKPGRHWIRLHFYPLTDNPTYNLKSAKFSVLTDKIVLLRDFSIPTADINPAPLLKEYLLDISTDTISIDFIPSKGSFAFINAIELISAPDNLIRNTATSVAPQGVFADLPNYALEVTHRLNVGGPLIPSSEDALAREWRPDVDLLQGAKAARNVSVSPQSIKYPSDGSVTALDAPSLVYATAAEMTDSNVPEPSFNVTWELPVSSKYSYLVRMHFCDIVSKNLNSLYFNIYLNGQMAAASLDLSTLANSDLAVAYLKDFVISAAAITNSTVIVQVGPDPGLASGNPNAILNGLEVMKMSNSAGSLDGPYAVDGSYHGDSEPSISVTKKIVVGVGLGMGALALALVAAMMYRWKQRPKNGDEKRSFSSWLLPLNQGKHENQPSFTSSSTKSGSSKSKQRQGSCKSKNGYPSYFASGGLGGVGRCFTFAELQEATKNFDDKAVCGVGGFGKVYIGELEDGTKLAVKRGNPSSEQGINEFQTEIEMLSKLRHRHLVSLIGYCDENSEMILVYEYMANGPLRDHLYGGGVPLPPLSWKQRLEVCIGAARGLHYLHTGAAQGIIHRDVKTTNILLDENLVAKMADFGLSKTGPSVQQTHVSTAVKGSFGYLDPEYFRTQQLTDKSDVYSFGVVLFEVLCARAAINPSLPREQVNLAEWAMKQNKRGQLDTIIDPHLVNATSPASLKKFVEAAEKCLSEYGVDRPTMGDVLWNLEYALQLHEASIGQTSDDVSGISARHIGYVENPADSEYVESPAHIGYVESPPHMDIGVLQTIYEEESTTAVPAPLLQGR